MLKKFWERRSPRSRVTGSATFHVAKGDEFNRQNNWPLAIQHYEKALAIDPTLVAVWVQLGHGFRETDDFPAAENAYREAVSIDDKSDDAWFFLGVTRRALNDEGEAFDAFLRAYNLNPNSAALAELAAIIGVSAKDIPDFLSAVNELFDPEGYLKLNHDLRAAGVNPTRHYLSYGWREARMFSAWFDDRYYAHKHKKLVGRIPSLLHYWRDGKAMNLRCSATGGKLWFEPKAPEVSEWAKLKSARVSDDNRATVILPVYKGYDETLASVFNAVSNRGSSRYGLLVINDCGPDAALNAELERLSDLGLFTYVVNDANLGFVQTCNRGICELSGDTDVVLLNSDAYVHSGWFDRLVGHADQDDAVATITPLSNNATICSYPVSDTDNYQQLELTVAELDALAATTNAGSSVETPTGVGFCFYMNRKAIKELGALDPVAFKVGYGEENDFCMRALAAGYKNLIAEDVFVFHVGSVSFSAIKDENFNAGQRALDIKHPSYTLLTRRHVNSDPTRHGRMRLDAARLIKAYSEPLIFITHSWGGGIETYLEGKRAALEQQGRPYLIVRVRDRSFVSIETSEAPYVSVPNLSAIDLRIDFDFFCEFITALNPELFHINSFAGLDWTHHSALLHFVRESKVPYRYIAHDYSAVSRFYHLTRPDNIYRGKPDWAALESWGRMIEPGPEDVGVLGERRAAYSSFLAEAQVVEFPSDAAREVLESFYPSMNVEVVPHDEPFITTERAIRRDRDGKLKVAVIGAIGAHKGSDVILALARDAKARELPIEYFIIGYSDQDAVMSATGVKISGAYSSEQEVIDHLAKIKPDLIFIPSVWPETYCYTLSIPLSLHLPFMVFDLGAQAERAATVGWGIKLEPSLINFPTRLSETILQLDIDELWGRVEDGN